MTSASGPVIPRVTLIALTQEASDALGTSALELAKLPFRVGRESRGPRWTLKGITTERRQSASAPNNELYIRETTEPLHVSREHFQIEATEGGVSLRDRGSTCGTIVEGKPIGGSGQGGTIALHDADVIIVGTAWSPFVFKVRLG